MYLYGSLVSGDFDPECSDIDLLAAIAAALTHGECKALGALHQDLACDYPQWAGRIEVAYVPVTALRTFRCARSPIAVISPGEHFHRTEAGREWLQNWYLVREQGMALFGPPAQEIIAPVSQEEFVQAIRDYAASLGERVKHVRDRNGMAYVILTMCRVLHVHRTGVPVSKRHAALWAQQELPAWSGLIQSALAWRAAWREEPVGQRTNPADTLRFVTYVLEQIQA